MSNICRPIVLYNDFLPPEDKPHENWDYFTFGYLDGVSIGKNLFCCNSSQCDLEELWNYDLEHTKNLKERCMAQIIYGFRYEENDSYDETFWKEALEENTKYPFIFVIFLHGIFAEEQINFKERQNLENELSKAGEIKAITYLTLDNSDLIMFILCKKYEYGSQIVNNFHYGKNKNALNKIGNKMSYSFTIAGIQKKFLNNIDAISKVQGQNIKNVFIYAVERYPGSITNIEKMFKKQLNSSVKRNPILGCNDEVMVAENVSWSNFLKCFQDKSGVLNHSFKYYKNNLLNVTTIIAQQQFEDKDDDLQHERENDDDDFKSLYQSFCKKLRKRVEQMDEEDISKQYQTLIHYLYYIINTLRKFEDIPLSDYLCFSMLLPINMVIDISKAVKDEDKSYFLKDCYEFIKGLDLCVQNSVRSDRQFMQSLDFDIRIYKTPVRLTAFYNAFIYYMKNFLGMLGRTNNTGHRYEFISCLGVTDNMQVQELFHNMSTDNRMFIVSIPEKQAYDVRLMLIMLGHEVGHFVGNVIRNREYRYKCSIKIASKIVTDYIKFALIKDSLYGSKERKYYIQNNDYWQEFNKKLENYLKIYMDNVNDINFLKENFFYGWDIGQEELNSINDAIKKYKYYTFSLKYLLLEGIVIILEKYSDDLFNYLLNMEYLYMIEKESINALEDKRKLSEKIGNIKTAICKERIWNKETLSISSSLDKMMYFFKECEADLVDILTLDLSLIDYLYAIEKCVLDQGVVDIEKIPKEIIIRSGLVTCCMLQPCENPKYFWDKEIEKEKTNNSGNENIKQISDKITLFINSYFEDRNEEHTSDVEYDEEYIKNRLFILGIFIDDKILNLLLTYLCECKKLFKEAFEKDDFEDNEWKKKMTGFQEQLINMYKLYQKDNIENIIWDMQKYIRKYKQLVQEEIRPL